MKLSRLLIAAVFIMGIFSSISLSAQDDREDVVYLKNGNIYRGIIIEQVPGKTIKVETLGGNVFTVDINDIVKLTKEKKVSIGNSGSETPRPYEGADMHHRDMDMHGQYHGRRDMQSYGPFRKTCTDSSAGCCSRNNKAFQYRNKGYFFKLQLLAEMGQGGVRIINGYKFSQFGYLGIGVGADIVGFAPVGHYDFGGKNSPYTGTYMPLFIHYSGDFLKKRITPFYTIEGGYALRYNGRTFGNFNNSNFRGQQGGMMGGVGIGVKFNSKRRLNFNISANADFQNVKYYSGYNYSGANGMTYRYGNTLSLLTPGLKFGIGF
jgi:hypothetical protein